MNDYRWIGEVRDALLADDLVEPPAWIRARARRLFQGRPRVPNLIQRVRATLIFDSRRAGAHVGVRSVVSEGQWQLLYRGGDVDIDLLVRLNQDGRTIAVRGQALSVAGDDIGAGEVEASPAGEAAQPGVRSPLEPTGEFAFANLSRGRYDVFVRLGAREIELTDVEL